MKTTPCSSWLDEGLAATLVAVDGELRDLLRRGDPRAAVLLARSGDRDEALTLLDEQSRAGDERAAELLLDIVGLRPDGERIALARWLHPLAHRGHARARELWQQWYPAFTAEGAWGGGFYEISIDLGPTSEERSRAALMALWSHPSLEGCYLEWGLEPWAQERHDLKTTSAETGAMRGMAALHTDAIVPCASFLLQDRHGDACLDFVVPCSALERAHPGGTPFAWPSLETLDWHAPLDVWFAALGQRVHVVTPFAHAVIGFEASDGPYGRAGSPDAPTPERYHAQLRQCEGKLDYFPIALPAT